jgi:hypothetical protein
MWNEKPKSETKSKKKKTTWVVVVVVVFSLRSRNFTEIFLF